jgi:DNA (cytosine-5)-methyltransferase 1
MDRLPSRLDVLCAGFPCTPFSPIGKRMGFEDTEKGKLFFEVARLAETSRPKAIFLENVKAMVYHDGGKALKSVLATLADLGYRTEWRVLDSSEFGLAQKRERVFIVGFRSPVFASRFSFPESGSGPRTIGSIMDAGVPEEFDATRAMLVGYLVKQKQRGRNRGGRFLPAFHGPGEISRTVVANGRILVTDGKRIRRLTPRECARLQGFPDSFRLPGSNTAVYRQLGNSVPVPVVEAIGRRIAEAMG